MRAHTKIKRSSVVIGVATAGVMALGTQSAAAHGDGQTVESRITISQDGDRFVYGEVKAGQVACVRRREVKVYSRRPGEDRRFEETTTTDRDGDWFRRPDGRWRPRRYFAVVTEEQKDGYLCTGDRSPGVMLGRRPPIGGRPRVKSVITIHASSNFQYFHGRVKAGKPTCRKDRKVRMWFLGDDSAGSKKTHTDGDGKWEFHTPFSAYSAIVKVTESRRLRLRHLCEADRARVLRAN